MLPHWFDLAASMIGICELGPIPVPGPYRDPTLLERLAPKIERVPTLPEVREAVARRSAAARQRIAGAPGRIRVNNSDG